MAKIVIFGIGQISEVAHFYFTNDSEHDVVAFTVDMEYLEGTEFHGLPVVAYENLVNKYPPDKYKIFIPISYKKVNKLRAEKFFDAKEKGYQFVSYISTRAVYYNTPIGENCFIFENNVLQPFSRIGDNCILWSGNHIGHHTIIEDHCFLASHVVISGSVIVGKYSFIGVNATIRDNVKVGKENVIGAGALILTDTDDNAVFSPKSTDCSKVPSYRLRNI